MAEQKTQAGKVDEIKKLLDSDKCAKAYYVHIVKGLKNNSFGYIDDHRYKNENSLSKFELLLLVFKEKDGVVLKREEEHDSECPDANMWLARVDTPEKIDEFVHCKNPFYFIEGLKAPHITTTSMGTTMYGKEGKVLFNERICRQKSLIDLSSENVTEINYLLTKEEAISLLD